MHKSLRRSFAIAAITVIAISLILIAQGYFPANPPPMQTIHSQQLPSPTTQPSPQLSPAQVVRTIMEALQNNDTPRPDTGIATTFAFASPANQRATGPLLRFITLVHNPVFAVMLNSEELDYGVPTIVADHAEIPVRLIDSEGNLAAFIFHLTRQTQAPYTNCWMTDSVDPLAPGPHLSTASRAARSTFGFRGTSVMFPNEDCTITTRSASE